MLLTQSTNLMANFMALSSKGLGEAYYKSARLQSFYIALRADINVNEHDVGHSLLSAKTSVPKMMGNKYPYFLKRPSM